MKKFLFLIIFIILLSPFSSINADGFIYYYYPEKEEWKIGKESKQIATIFYEKGREKLLISVIPVPYLLESAKEGIWIIPVPSEPKDVDIEIKDDFPILVGVDYFNQEERINFTLFTLYISLFLSVPIGIYADIFLWSLLFPHKGVTDVQIYQKVEKYGIFAEVLSVKNREDFYNYLKTKNIKLPEETMNSINYYIDKDYSFVLCKFGKVFLEEMEFWREEGITLSPSLYIEFPTKKIYYPLKLTSVYGDNEFSVKIQVIGFVSPEIPSELSSYTEIKYDFFPSNGIYIGFSPKKYTIDTVYKILNSQPISPRLPFTLINIQAPAKVFKKDIYILNKVPFKIKMRENWRTFLHTPWIFLPISFALLSIISIFISHMALRFGFQLKTLIKLIGWSFLGLPALIPALLILTRGIKSKMRKFLFLVLYIFLFIILALLYKKFLLLI